jgi:hypothetical protein
MEIKSHAEEGQFSWILRYSTRIAVGLAALFMVAFVVYQWMHKTQSHDLKEFLTADNLYTRWKEKPLENQESLDKLKKIISALPQLKTRFEPLIAQELLAIGSSEITPSFAAAALKRIKKGNPYYTDFAYTTLLIANGELQDALDQALTLKSMIDKDPSFAKEGSVHTHVGHLLYAYNLLRISLLQKEVGSTQGEFLAWSELEKKAGWQEETVELTPVQKEVYSLLEENFAQNQITLKEWVKHRKNVLTQNL